MRTETKVLQIANSPSEINAVNASQALWGWSVLSVQITDRKTVYDGDTTGYVNELGLHATTQRITETANYATITYSRDLDAPNTAELRRLEKEYENQTSLAAMYAVSTEDESYLTDTEEREWYKNYQAKSQEGYHIGSVAILYAVIAAVILLTNSVNEYSTGEMVLLLAVVALLFVAYMTKGFFDHKKTLAFVNDPQNKSRYTELVQRIEEGKAKQKAGYDEAMALRAALVKQAQALTGN